MKTEFPLTLAEGRRFCGRIEERARLKHNIDQGTHTVLISPRKYGKSSLVHKSISELKLPFASVDLFLAYDDLSVCERILNGVSEIISKLSTVSNKLLTALSTYFKNTNITFSAGMLSLQLKHSQQNPIETLTQVLLGLEAFAKSKNKTVIFFIDEFQDMSQAQHSKAIQGAIRHALQKSQYVRYIFSGSSRKMLSKIFEDDTQPLYMACDKLFLERIDGSYYTHYIQSAAKRKWKKEISKSCFDLILKLTERHPFYVNLLCNEIWLHVKYPNEESILKAWETCRDRELRRIKNQLETLSLNQRLLLKNIAFENHLTAPLSSEFSKTVSIPTGSIAQALEALYDKDYIYKRKDGAIRPLDPLIGFTLQSLYENQVG